MSIIENLLQLSLPAIIMLTGLVITLLGMGSEIYKVKVALQAYKRVLFILGLPLLIFGALLSILLVWKEIFGALPQFPDRWFWYSLFNIYRVARYLFVIAIAIILYATYWLLTEKAFGVDASFVNSSKQRANIRIEHKGGKAFNCIVKLEEVATIPRNGDREIQDIDKLNPDGRFFEWEDKNWFSKIDKDYPKVVRIVGANEWENYSSNKTHFVYYGATSPDLNNKCKHEITVGIYRLRGSKHIKMKSVKRVLQIHGDGLSWEAA